MTKEWWIRGGRTDNRSDWVSEVPQPGLTHVIEKSVFDEAIKIIEYYANSCWYPDCADEGQKGKDFIKKIRTVV